MMRIILRIILQLKVSLCLIVLNELCAENANTQKHGACMLNAIDIQGSFIIFFTCKIFSFWDAQSEAKK